MYKIQPDIAGYIISIPINQQLFKGGIYMKKIKKLLIVSGILMALGLVVPVVAGNAKANTQELTICSNLPPVDSVGFPL